MLLKTPNITRWTIYVDPRLGDPATEKKWAGKLADFLDAAKVGDMIKFTEDVEDPDYTFSLVGDVHGKSGKDFVDGDPIRTSYVVSFKRVEGGFLDAVYEVRTKNSTYYVDGNESRLLIRAIASI
ncbi:hypothetical protein J5500_00705 [Candidatus Saccharibacteria bacterium]|nr:hypothetical protein [Candidatus Saccharibacteria bacterium]